jgi:isochorismate synthase
MAPIFSVTRRFDGELDLDAIAGGDGYLFVRDGVGIAARGSILSIPVDEVPLRLSDIDADDDVCRPASGPVAIGAVPFLPGTPAELVLPELLAVRDVDGCQWLTRIGIGEPPPPPSPDDLPSTEPPVPRAGAYAVEPLTDPATYLDAVRAVRHAVRAGRLVKAVVARCIEVRSDAPIDVHAVLLRLRAAFGSSYRFSIDGLIGASPELLVEVREGIVRSHPLAGTAPRTGDPDTDTRLAADLVRSVKDQIEHRVVIDVVNETLLPWCSFLDWEPEPSIVTVANVQHLGTRVEGPLSQPVPNVLELVAALSPTPALGGHPRDDALSLLAEVEHLDRGRYGGAVGWVDSRGNGTWAVAIRCAELADDRRSARLFAGGGIVADSDPLAELAETQAKFQAMLSAIVRA